MNNYAMAVMLIMYSLSIITSNLNNRVWFRLSCCATVLSVIGTVVLLIAETYYGFGAVEGY